MNSRASVIATASTPGARRRIHGSLMLGLASIPTGAIDARRCGRSALRSACGNVTAGACQERPHRKSTGRRPDGCDAPPIPAPDEEHAHLTVRGRHPHDDFAGAGFARRWADHKRSGQLDRDGDERWVSSRECTLRHLDGLRAEVPSERSARNGNRGARRRIGGRGHHRCRWALRGRRGHDRLRRRAGRAGGDTCQHGQREKRVRASRHPSDYRVVAKIGSSPFERSPRQPISVGCTGAPSS
jgi:hypothetical protein